MPALVNSSVGSPCGTSELLRTTVCPLLLKKSRKALRILFPLHLIWSPVVVVCVPSAVTLAAKEKLWNVFIMADRAGKWRAASGQKSSGQTAAQREKG